MFGVWRRENNAPVESPSDTPSLDVLKPSTPQVNFSGFLSSRHPPTTQLCGSTGKEEVYTGTRGEDRGSKGDRRNIWQGRREIDKVPHRPQPTPLVASPFSLLVFFRQMMRPVTTRFILFFFKKINVVNLRFFKSQD